MKNETRFIGQMFLLPLVGAVWLVAWCHWVDVEYAGVVFADADYGSSLQTFCWLFVGACVFSIVYTVVMDVLYDLGLKPSTWATVLYSEVFCVLVGIFYDRVVFVDNKVYNQGFALEMVGAITGLTMGLIIKKFFGKPPMVRLPLEI